MSPQRIQRQRTKGWRMPEGAVYVGRPTHWGNPWRVEPFMGGWSVDGPFGHEDVYEGATGARQRAVDEYRAHVLPAFDQRVVDVFLRGRDLACWCPLTYPDGTIVPCHADVLLELANGEADRLREPDGEAV